MAGRCKLTARAADGIVQNLVDAGGRIRAATMGEQTGTIALNGVGGSIIVEGQLSATGRQPGTTGGAIEVVTDQNVVVAGTAKLNASGTAGGGTVAIGTTLARASGGPTVTPTLTAKNVLVANGAAHPAATTPLKKAQMGDRSDISASATAMNGTITAKGGSAAGNGGFIETSGPVLSVGTNAVGERCRAIRRTGWLSYGCWTRSTSPSPVLTAIRPRPGKLSPDQLIPQQSPTRRTASPRRRPAMSSSRPAGGGAPDQGNITVSVSRHLERSTRSLTLDADNNILVNAAISATKGDLVFNAGTTTATGSITISASVAAQTFTASTGASGTINLNFSTAPVVATSGGGQTYNNRLSCFRRAPQSPTAAMARSSLPARWMARRA